MGNERDFIDPRRAASPPAPLLPYESPGAHQRSQWVTDDGPGGKWLVGCLIVLSVVGVLGGLIAGVAWFLVGI